MMTTFVEKHKVPGAALAVTRGGKLVCSRGFGYADVEKKEPVEPASLFRIASISKPFTSVTVLRLVERGKLKLSDKVIDHLKIAPHVPPGGKVDPRWKDITVAHCLRHTGGWDRDKSGDPIGKMGEISKSLGTPLPVTPDHLVRYMMGQPLDFDPGTKAVYSNLGYLVLGRIIETLAGPYEATVRKEVLKPLGITTMRLGRARLEHRAKDEVRYYPAKPWTGSAVIGPKIGEQVPGQYGVQNFEAFEAHGGWIASAADLVRFASAFDDPKKCPLLKEETIRTMHARPEGLAGYDDKGKPMPLYLGCGWMVRPVGDQGKANVFHSGYISGTSTLLVRRWDGLNWAVLFNSDQDPDRKTLSGLIDPLVHEAADQVKNWPMGK
ncbi:serine hydrolase domain-containing protein [Zavarzinella formosa]|uniref:serine hydrolase domain-containing protein n=1 Tax=Zavarzinella formosa TaxID=360055 RepID=UPI001EE67F04|nr:serine hydrolase domain-containing protein [Zavarzinella formosa]